MYAQSGEQLHTWYNNASDLWNDVQTGARWITGGGRAIQTAGQGISNAANNISNATSWRLDGQTVLFATIGIAAALLVSERRRHNPPRRARRRRR